MASVRWPGAAPGAAPAAGGPGRTARPPASGGRPAAPWRGSAAAGVRPAASWRGSAAARVWPTTRIGTAARGRLAWGGGIAWRCGVRPPRV